MIDANLIDKANIPNLILALRECGERAFCNDCPIFDTCDGDIDRAMHDAADAIEALQAYVPKRGELILTNDEIEMIRIHMNAIKEQLCNQYRHREAEAYQTIVDKLAKMEAQDGQK